MPLWLDLLRTPMAAPETRSLRRMRFTWQVLCVASALASGFFAPFHRIAGRAAPITVAVLLAVTLPYTALYLIRKQRADHTFLDGIGSAEQ